MGAGAALGMTTVNNSISVGYLVAAVESGVIGGILYLCLFIVMGWGAFKIIVTSNNESFDELVKVVVALSVCTVLVMGAQRIQPDLSFWHMWIYAMMFYLLQKTMVVPNNQTVI
jgi:O-antigen ligase